MIEVPSDSIYFWMYTQGLKQVDIQEIQDACFKAGKEIRPKDFENYWNGFHNSSLYHSSRADDFVLTRKPDKEISSSKDFFNRDYLLYEDHPWCDMPEIQNRWVPCSKDNKPMIKWSQGCMTLSDAVAYKDQVYLAENLKGTQMIVIDCDGNHDVPWDYETMAFLWHYSHMTHCITKGPQNKPGMLGHFKDDIPPSFHLTFQVTKIIPTMHFPYAHIDIVGNRMNSLRYWKNKKWNGIKPALMTEDIWKELQKYIKYRKEKANA